MFLGYDEVSHHSGIERPETLRELAKIDKAFTRLARAAADASRSYHLVVLADVDHADDVWVAQLGHGTGLAAEALELVGVRRAGRSPTRR
jgi:hypothetical protein